MRKFLVVGALLGMVVASVGLGQPRVQAQTSPVEHYFAIYLVQEQPGSLNPRPVECTGYAVYNGVIEFWVTPPDGQRRIVFGAPLTNVRSYYEYNYPGYGQ